MANRIHGDSNRLEIGDLIAGIRALLWPLAVVVVLVAVARLFRDAPAAENSQSGAWLLSVPHEAWIWACIGYLALVLPRQPLTLRIPGIPWLVKALVLVIAGGGFCLELRFHEILAPIMQAGLAVIVAVLGVLAAATSVRIERARRVEASETKDRAIEQMIRGYEKLNNQPTPDPSVTHPALFARVGKIVRSPSPNGTSIWFLKPHPALGHKRPIDVLREPGGEDKLLNALRLGPN